MSASTTASDRQSFLARLRAGDYGLAKTFWLYTVVVGMVANLVIGFIPQASMVLVLTAVFLMYYVMALVGTWRAASRYTGKKVWAILAKIMVGVWSLSLVSAILLLSGMGGR